MTPCEGGREPKASGGLALNRFRERQRLFNARAHCIELLRHFRIRKPNDGNAERGQVLGSCFVIPFSAVGEMGISVDLDDETLPGTIEICNVTAKRLLTCELLAMS